jgi:hypothetical protein
VTLFEDDDSDAIPYTYKVKGSVTNISSKPVVLAVVHFGSRDVKGPTLSFTYEKDYFFDSRFFMPGTADTVRSSLLRLGRSKIDGQPAADEAAGNSTPTATAKVVFVQFLDGSTWGDTGLAIEPLRIRNKTVEELGRMRQVLKDEGQRAFDTRLSNTETLLPCIQSLKNTCNDKADSCLVDGMQSMIKAAEQHESSMKTDADARTDQHR